MELIHRYFPGLSKQQNEQLSALDALYREWNSKINVISRRDIDHLYEHHILHSLALTRYNPFQSGMKVLDVGTGGGFPGIPLAIFYPQIQFTLLDSIAKKIHVVNEVSLSLGLKNVTAIQARAEACEGEYDMVICRAVSTLAQIVEWTKHLVPSSRWIILKGGDTKEMRKELPPQFKMKFIAVSDYFSEEYFIQKYIVDIKMTP